MNKYLLLIFISSTLVGCNSETKRSNEEKQPKYDSLIFGSNNNKRFREIAAPFDLLYSNGRMISRFYDDSTVIVKVDIGNLNRLKVQLTSSNENTHIEPIEGQANLFKITTKKLKVDHNGRYYSRTIIHNNLREFNYVSVNRSKVDNEKEYSDYIIESDTLVLNEIEIK